MAPNTSPPDGRPEPGQRASVEITTMGSHAVGIARLDGFTLMIERAIPGDVAEVEITRAHPRYAEGEVVSLQTPSVHRAEPACPHFDECGGCDWLNMNYPAQVLFKTQTAKDQLERLGKLTLPADWEVIRAGKAMEYRDKLEFALCQTESGVKPAFHGRAQGEQGHSTLIPITQCLLAPPAFTALATKAAQLLEKIALAAQAPPVVHRVTVQGTANHKGTGLALLLHCGEDTQPQVLAEAAMKLEDDLKEDFPTLVSIGTTYKQGTGAKSFRDWQALTGKEMLEKNVGGRTYLAPLAGFFQVNAAQAAKLIDHLLEKIPAHVPPGSVLFDLFCGAGLFSMPLVERGYAVVGAERNREAIRAARASAKELPQDGKNHFHTVDLEQNNALEVLADKEAMPEAILVNPPRKGLPKNLARSINHIKPKTIFYVSCNAATLARDANRLAPLYELNSLKGFDLFPQTHHLELIAVFTRK